MVFDLAYDIFYQGLGICGALCAFLSFQCKDNRKYLALQGLVSIFFLTQFFLGQAWAGFLMNILCIIRVIGYIFIKDKRWIIAFTVLVSLGFVGCAVASVVWLNEYWYIALATGAGSIVSAIAMATKNNTFIRWSQLLFVSPCWLFNNAFYHSIGGVITEIMNMASVLIAFYRFRKKPEPPISL